MQDGGPTILKPPETKIISGPESSLFKINFSVDEKIIAHFSQKTRALKVTRWKYLFLILTENTVKRQL